MRLLADWHLRAASVVADFIKDNPPYDPGFVKRSEWDYFISGLKLLDIIPEQGKEFLAEANKLSEKVTFPKQPQVLIHRDFQSRNIMIQDDQPRIIDWQGARLGPPSYDLASLLYDPYVDLADDFRDNCLKVYLEALGQSSCFALWQQKLFVSAVMRLMQAAGAYLNLWKNKSKAPYSEVVWPAVSRIMALLGCIEADKFPVLSDFIESALNVLTEKKCLP
jgi:aminoglycoside/choline kinase family phosphotransferase